MGPETVFLIPITAIVLGIGSRIVTTILRSQERHLELRLNAQQGQNDQVIQQVQALRAEIGALRDTSTSFDLSLEDNVQQLEQRLGFLESKAAAPSYTTREAPKYQSNEVGT
jgi:hypothetical protein